MSDSNVRYVGLDVHKRVVEACLISRDGQVLRRDRLAMSRSYLEIYAREVLRPTDRVALEATTNTWAVVGALRRTWPKSSSPIPWPPVRSPRPR